MLRIQNWERLSENEKTSELCRGIQNKEESLQVESIISAVRAKGDEAIKQFTKNFDKITLSELQISKEKIANAKIASEAENAIKASIETVKIYHEAIMPSSLFINTAKGITIERCYKAIDKVGLYVPGGNNTPLISSLIMQAIPALVAGCRLRILSSPVNSQGEIDPHLLVAARLCEISSLFTIGGAQAIAAMAYGTKTVPKVDKIFGPGNRYVTEAKTQISNDPAGAAIDMPAGPSELMILADDKANPIYIAADLLAQAEHGADSQVFLICESQDFAEKVNQSLKLQFQTLKRQNLIEKSFKKSSILICQDRKKTLDIINTYAPEHLIINRQDNKTWVNEVRNAGTIFLGPWAAETMGDYISGSNHVLPTNGFARNHSGLSTLDFLKSITIQSISREGVLSLGEKAYTLAMLEGLDGHANAVKQRLISENEK